MQAFDNDLKLNDFYESKFDLNALKLADLSLQSSSDSQDYSEFKRAIKFSLFFQPTFSVCWFLGVIALENRHSCVMPIIFIIVYNILVNNFSCHPSVQATKTLYFKLINFVVVSELVCAVSIAIYQSRNIFDK